MIVFLDKQGNVITSSTDHIGRNSNNASIIYVVGYIPSAATVYMTFTLPNGKTLFGGLAGQASGDDAPQVASPLLSLEGISAWRYDVPSSVTALSGVVGYDIYAQTESMLASASGTFTVSRGNRIELPPSPPADAWGEITAVLSDLEGDLNSLGAFVGYQDGVSYTKTILERILSLEAPNGTVTEGETAPVSGGDVYNAIKESEQRTDGAIAEAKEEAISEAVADAKEYTDHPYGIVADGVTLPVSGGNIFSFVSKQLAPIDSRITALEEVLNGDTFFFQTETIDGKGVVPEGSLNFARIETMGGNTRKTKNLLKLTPDLDLGTVLGTTYSTDENGYFCIDNGGNGGGVVSAYFDGLGLLASEPTAITISARYISGTAVGPVEGVSPTITLLGKTIYAPTADNPLTYLVVSNMTYDNVDSFAVGDFADYKIALMVEEGTTLTDYQPYYEGLKSATVTAIRSYKADGSLLDTLSIPESVRSISGYGLGISETNNNAVDFESKTFTKRNAIAQISPDWNWAKNSSGQNQYYADHGLSNVGGYMECYCNNFTGSPRGAYDAWGEGDNFISFSKSLAWIEASKFASADELEAFLRDNPTYAVYTLATPTTTDISDLTSMPYIKVEQGGHVEAVSNDGVAAYLTVTFQIQVKGGSV